MTINMSAQRCFGKQDRNAKGRVNAIGALLAGVLLSVGLATSNADADIFTLWIEHDLLPKLPAAAVPVMDRVTFHRRPDTTTAVVAAGHTLEYLPSYRPDLNDIEHKWAEAKAYRCKTGKSVDEIFSRQF